MPLPLPRRPAIGLRCVASPAGGALVRELRAGSAAAALLRPGDRLLALDERPISDPSQLAALLRPRRGGELLRLRVARGEALLAVDLHLDDLPHETCPDAHVLYDSIEVAGVRLRTITVRPPGPGPHPAWLLLPGLACSSQDFAVAPGHPLRPLVEALVGAGVVSMRVERPGLGDSEGGPCEALGFLAERDIFAAGLAALRARAFVDPEALGLFGHSVGGMLAPLLAGAGEVRRIAVYGSCALPWPQVVRRSAERQAARTGQDIAALVAGARTGRDPRFTDELSAIDLAAAWSRVTADVLVVRGALDQAVADVDARALVELLAARPRAWTGFIEVPGADHDLGVHPDLAASLRAPGSGAACPALYAALARFARGLRPEV
ncbi:PDZ domain-containing protein [Nannocystis sp.]|uniref:PDZ domain-containing protein n=1 Tax=Nannocystis sp. TaxID=1962667 RepID=UPI0025D393E2|nr:PDZ domain-containing protein [Nannocystis sp.]MBK7827416.1 PDZ domain-containing protein [Nannocystis sp.]